MTTPQSHSRRLREKIELISPSMHEATGAFWSHPRLRAIFPEFLFTTYTLGRATVSLLETAAAAARGQWSADAVATAVAKYCEAHIPEEAGHDEGVLGDLETLGVPRETAMRRIASPTMAALVGAQYYWMQYAHPVALLGYLEVLEGEPPEAAFLEGVIARTGLPRKALRTYFQHAVLDLKHRDDLHKALDRMPLGAEHEAILGVSAFQTVALVGQIFRELAALEPEDTARGAFSD